MQSLLFFAILIGAAFSLPIEDGSGVVTLGEAEVIEASAETVVDDVGLALPLRARRDNGEGSGKEDRCISMDICYSDADCHGGQCIGAFVGKCGCNGCIEMARCDEDSMCGGLKGACDLIMDNCMCSQAFVKLGFSSLSDALINFCNVKPCTQKNETEQCFGMACQFGTCLCSTEL